jgi:hypothetical protein
VIVGIGKSSQGYDIRQEGRGCQGALLGL